MIDAFFGILSVYSKWNKLEIIILLGLEYSAWYWCIEIIIIMYQNRQHSRYCDCIENINYYFSRIFHYLFSAILLIIGVFFFWLIIIIHLYINCTCYMIPVKLYFVSSISPLPKYHIGIIFSLFHIICNSVYLWEYLLETWDWPFTSGHKP